MKLEDSPLRTLVKTFASGVIDRDEYLRLRNRLLQQLEDTGRIRDTDLEHLLKSSSSESAPQAPNHDHYSLGDWLLVLLGLGAAIGLAIILYN